MNLRLSEAIRLGAMLKPQAKNYFQINGATCANGAALDAIGKLSTPVEHHGDLVSRGIECYDAYYEQWPYTKGGLDQEIVDLNNKEGWTRERIADWVESKERELGLWDKETTVEEIPVYV